MIPLEYRMSGGGAASASKRALILHDSVTFALLLVVTFALFGVTLFLFQSFNAHRADLARRWADEGRTELAQGEPALAVGSLRAALSYAPDDYQTQLLLAQALSDAGELDQATNYFLNLWEARPGDGFLNLELARLAAKKGNREDAIKYYRASIFGDWRGDGSIKRRDVRLELVDYLVAHGDLQAARVELLIAAGNAPSSLHLNLMFADKLQAIGDAEDANIYYRKAIAEDAHNAAALEGAGRIAYGRGDYQEAHQLLERAAADTPSHDAKRQELAALARDADRMMELSLSRELPARERAEHLLVSAKIAEARLNACAAEPSASPADLLELETRWKAASAGAKRNALAADAAGQDELTQLIFDTERQTAGVCGPPEGDDALLLKMAEKP